MSDSGIGPPGKFCSACGNGLHERAEICPKCGVRQIAPAAAGARSRTSAILFALLLGGIGGHKFYLGKTGQGLLYLFFCWTFIPALIALIELVMFIAMNDQTFDQKYNT